jgi:ribonuclease P protein component
MVIHANPTDTRVGEPPRVGFVVSKAVGNAVVRNRTKRVLRALMRARIGQVPDGVDVVVKANPELPGTSHALMIQDLDRLLGTVIRRISTQEGQ